MIWEVIMKIVQYDKHYAQDFIALNTAWIVDLFGQLEKEDIETFQNIEEEISNGGMIYFAIEENKVMATCMVRNIDNGTWEICKLAANEKFKGKGAGNAVFEQCMKYAIEHGAKKLFMLSNSSLKAALHIYYKYGFKEIKLKDYEYERGDIAFELTVNQCFASGSLCDSYGES